MRCLVKEQNVSVFPLTSMEYNDVLPKQFLSRMSVDAYNFAWKKSTLYRVSHKKRNGGFSVHCERKVINNFTSPYKVFSAEENDT